MRFFNLSLFLFLFCLSSCQTNSYVFVDSYQKYGVDFTKGRWLLNELDCPRNSSEKLTSITTEFFQNKLHDRLFYIKDVQGILIARKTSLKPNKTKLKELKDGTGYDFFINIVVRKKQV